MKRGVGPGHVRSFSEISDEFVYFTYSPPHEEVNKGEQNHLNQKWLAEFVMDFKPNFFFF